MRDRILAGLALVGLFLAVAFLTFAYVALGIAQGVW